MDSTQEPGLYFPPPAWFFSRYGAGVLLELKVGSLLYHSSGLKPPPRILSSLFPSNQNSCQAARPEESSTLQEIPFRLLQPTGTPHSCILYQTDRKSCRGLNGPCCSLPPCLCICSLRLELLYVFKTCRSAPKSLCSHLLILITLFKIIVQPPFRLRVHACQQSASYRNCYIIIVLLLILIIIINYYYYILVVVKKCRKGILSKDLA